MEPDEAVTGADLSVTTLDGGVLAGAQALAYLEEQGWTVRDGVLVPLSPPPLPPELSLTLAQLVGTTSADRRAVRRFNANWQAQEKMHARVEKMRARQAARVQAREEAARATVVVTAGRGGPHRRRTPHVTASPRGRAPARRVARARAPDGDSDPEPPAPRRCARCGDDISHRRKQAKTCGRKCRVRKFRSEHAADTPPEPWTVVETAAVHLVRRGKRRPEEALLAVLTAMNDPAHANWAIGAVAA